MVLHYSWGRTYKPETRARAKKKREREREKLGRARITHGETVSNPGLSRKVDRARMDFPASCTATRLFVAPTYALRPPGRGYFCPSRRSSLYTDMRAWLVCSKLACWGSRFYFLGGELKMIGCGGFIGNTNFERFYKSCGFLLYLDVWIFFFCGWIVNF